MKLSLNISILFILSNFLFGQNDFIFDNELIKKNNVQSIEAKLISFRKEQIDSISSNIILYEFDKNGNVYKETSYDYFKDYVTMYGWYEYDSNCLKVSNFEIFMTEDFKNYSSLISNKTFYDKNCKVDSIQNYHLGNLESTDYYRYKNQKIESILTIHADKTSEEAFYNTINKFERETIVIKNGRIEAKYIDKLDKRKNVTEFCDLVEEKKACSKYEYVYKNNKIIKESYFNQYKMLDHILEFDYLENGLVNKKTTYLVNENGESFLSSIINYSYKYF